MTIVTISGGKDPENVELLLAELSRWRTKKCLLCAFDIAVKSAKLHLSSTFGAIPWETARAHIDPVGADNLKVVLYLAQVTAASALPKWE